MGLDIRIVMVKNEQQIKHENFWDICKSGWIINEDDIIDYSQPCEVYYARKFWPFWVMMSNILHIDNGEFSEPLTKENIETMINIATHYRDYWGNFNSVPLLCEILDRYDEATKNGMIFLFEGDY